MVGVPQIATPTNTLLPYTTFFRCFDSDYVDPEDLSAFRYVYHLLKAVGGMRVGGGFALELLGRFGRHLSQHALEPFDLGHAAFLGKALAHSVERVGEPLGLDRLDQIVDRLRFEGADRMIRIGGDEDDERRSEEHTSELQSLMRNSY